MSDDEKKPTIDERLEAIVQSLELMAHESEAHRKEMQRIDRQQKNAREALLAGIAAYLRVIRENGENGDDGQQ